MTIAVQGPVPEVSAAPKGAQREASDSARGTRLGVSARWTLRLSNIHYSLVDSIEALYRRSNDHPETKPHSSLKEAVRPLTAGNGHRQRSVDLPGLSAYVRVTRC